MSRRRRNATYLNIGLLREYVHRMSSSGGLLAIGTVTGDLLSVGGGTIRPEGGMLTCISGSEKGQKEACLNPPHHQPKKIEYLIRGEYKSTRSVHSVTQDTCVQDVSYNVTADHSRSSKESKLTQ